MKDIVDKECSEDMFLCFSQNRNMVAHSGHIDYVDFDENMLIVAFENLKNKISRL